MAKSALGDNIQPLFDNVLIRPLEPEQRTASGIVLPDTVKEKPQIGQVMAVGPGTTDDKGKKVPVQVRKGQKVLYKKWGGNEVKVGTEDWMILEQKDILAVYG
jgi:chaperonin GroES